MTASPLLCSAVVRSLHQTGDNIWSLILHAPLIAAHARPGQFVNVRVADSLVPLLRRPFSISRINGVELAILFNIVGPGTRLLTDKRPGDVVDLLGPLGKPFDIDEVFDTALIVAGGLGVAPFQFLEQELHRLNKPIVSFVGARTASGLSVEGLENVREATDDGTAGRKGTVVELVAEYLDAEKPKRPKLFACGPTPMLKALREFAVNRRLLCELSLEGAMACGIGICQGCPVQRTGEGKKYALVCTDGPTFRAEEIVLS